jgi:hypothetical protein
MGVSKAQFYQSIGVCEDNTHTRGKHFWLEKCAVCGNMVRVTDNTSKDRYFLVSGKLVCLCDLHRPKAIPKKVYEVIRDCGKLEKGKAMQVSEVMDSKLYAQLRAWIKKENKNMKVVSVNKQIWIYNFEDTK